KRGGYAFEDLFDPNAPHPAAGSTTIETAGFISPSDYQGPKIIEAELPHPDISESDVVYLDIGSSHGGAPGAEWQKIRTRRPVFRPSEVGKVESSYLTVGVLMQQVGRLKVVCVQQTSSIAVITKAFSYIERGDFIIPYTKREAPMVTGSPPNDHCNP